MSKNDYNATMQSYMTERNWIADVLETLGASLEKFEEVSDVAYEPHIGISFKVGNESISMNIADIPYPPIRPQNFMAEVQLAKKGPYVLGGLKVPFMEEAHGTKNVRMWGYEKDTTKDRSAFLHCLTEVLANLAFDNNPLAQVRLHDIVLAAAKAVDQAEPFSLDAMRAPKPNPRANDLVL